MEIVNTRLLGHPMNWFIVWAILAVMSFGFHAVMSRVQAATSISPD